MEEIARRLELACIRIQQPIGDFYAGALKARDICEITFFDVRTTLTEHRVVDRYLRIQRELSPDRVADLQRYVNTVDATFPSLIILAVEDSCVDINDSGTEMMLHPFEGSEGRPPIPYNMIARVLDGQHRIAGLSKYNGNEFEVPVSIFVGADISDQAMIFSTVNLQQTKVSKSLAYDLFDLAKSRSPQKSAHNIAIALDEEPTSPPPHQIKGRVVPPPGGEPETISKATFVEALVSLISSNPSADRDTL